MFEVHLYFSNLKVNSLFSLKSREQVQQTCRLDALHPEVDSNIFMPKEQNVLVNICVCLFITKWQKEFRTKPKMKIYMLILSL